MSSLLQFNGQISRKGVQLEAYLVLEDDEFKPAESVPCETCGGAHPQLYGFWRKPAGMMGCWVVFRYNGEEHVPDLSIPIRLRTLPRDARPFSLGENAKSWHS